MRVRVLTEEYIKKGRNVDRVYWEAAEGTMGRVERKLVDMGKVRGLQLEQLVRQVKGFMKGGHNLANSKLKLDAW